MLRGRGLDALRYHAGLEEEERTRSQERFLVGGAPLMVATNAFGMGVDRPDVRRVVHFEIPRTVEAYVQEAGRAGRDGLPAECTLLFHPGDIHIQRWFLESANPSREVVAEVFRVLLDVGERRLEMTAEDIAARMRVETPPAAVSSALAVLDRAALVRRGRRGENRARLRVLPPPDDLFAAIPVPPGLGRLLAWLEKRHGTDVEASLDVEETADLLGRSEETVRRALQRLHEMGRIVYAPPFRGRATEIRAPLHGEGVPEDLLAAVDFGELAEKRRREERKLDEIVGYAQVPGCRVRYLLDAFGAPGAARCGRCDGCRDAARSGPEHVPTEGERAVVSRVLEAVRSHDGRFGFRRIAEHLYGSKNRAIAHGRLSRGPTYGALSALSLSAVEEWVHAVYDAGLLRLVATRLDDRRPAHLVALSSSGRAALLGGPLPAIRR
jgi:ATP-dependent DNA helicase RecQ